MIDKVVISLFVGFSKEHNYLGALHQIYSHLVEKGSNHYTFSLPPQAFVVSLTFLIYLAFFFPRVFDVGIKNARTNVRKTFESLFILHYALGKNVSPLHFLAFLLVFLLTNLTKCNPNA